jgi:hypothetical protein
MTAPLNKLQLLIYAVIVIPIAAVVGMWSAARQEVGEIRRMWRGHWTKEEMEP